MSDIGETFRDLREARQTIGHERRWSAGDLYHEAAARAYRAGLDLTRHNEAHYSLAREGGWRLNIYPGNGRLYMDRNHARAPFLALPEGWTILDVVDAAIRQESRQ